MLHSWRGRYFDGESAEPRPVTVTLADGMLLMHDEAGAPCAVWPLSQTRLIDRAGGGLRLGCANRAEARLAVADPTLEEGLRFVAPAVLRRGAPAAARSWIAASAATLAVLALGYFTLPSLSQLAARLAPSSWEASLGEHVVRRISPVSACRQAAGVAALGKLTRLLARDPEDFARLDVRVVNDSRVNAFSAPGGRIVLLRGLLDEARSADEVAGVLAHEIGHDMRRHATAAVIRKAGASMAFAMLFGDGSWTGRAGALLVDLDYSRDDEHEADAVAGELLDDAAISRAGMAAFFTRQAAKRPSLGALTYLSTHPAPEERQAQFASEGPRQQPLSPGEWAALKAICG